LAKIDINGRLIGVALICPMYKLTTETKCYVLAHGPFAQLERHLPKQLCSTHTFNIPQLFCYLDFISKISLLALRVPTSRAPKCARDLSCTIYAFLEMNVLRLVNVNSQPFFVKSECHFEWLQSTY